MELDFLKWLIDNNHLSITIDFNLIVWDYINFCVQSQLSSQELYKLSNEYYN